MTRHVIKYEYDDGKKLEVPILWCGRESIGFEFEFKDAQHVALAVGGSIAPCKSCIRAIIRQLNKELAQRGLNDGAAKTYGNFSRYGPWWVRPVYHP